MLVTGVLLQGGGGAVALAATAVGASLAGVAAVGAEGSVEEIALGGGVASCKGGGGCDGQGGLRGDWLVSPPDPPALHGRQGAQLKRLRALSLRHRVARVSLHVVDGLHLAADGERLLLADGGPAGLGELCCCLCVRAEVLLAAAEHHGCVRTVTADVASPLVLDVVERDRVGDLVTEEEDVGLLVGQRAHGVVRGGA